MLSVTAIELTSRRATLPVFKRFVARRRGCKRCFPTTFYEFSAFLGDPSPAALASASMQTRMISAAPASLSTADRHGVCRDRRPPRHETVTYEGCARGGPHVDRKMCQPHCPVEVRRRPSARQVFAAAAVPSAPRQAPVVSVSLPDISALGVSRQVERDLSLRTGPARDAGRRPRAPARRFVWREDTAITSVLKARIR